LRLGSAQHAFRRSDPFPDQDQWCEQNPQGFEKDFKNKLHGEQALQVKQAPDYGGWPEFWSRRLTSQFRALNWRPLSIRSPTSFN
jgi:hypothetical protein